MVEREEQSKLRKLALKVLSLDEELKRVKETFEEARERLLELLARHKIDALEVEDAGATVHRVVPQKRTADKDAVARVLKYKDFVAVAEVSVTALAAVMKPEDLDKVVYVTEGRPYLRITREKKAP